MNKMIYVSRYLPIPTSFSLPKSDHQSILLEPYRHWVFSSDHNHLENNSSQISFAQVWAMFSDEVQEAKKDMVATRSQHPADLPSFAGRATVLKMRKNRLVYLKKVCLERLPQF